MTEEQELETQEEAIDAATTDESKKTETQQPQNVPYGRFQEVISEKNTWKERAEQAQATLEEIRVKEEKARKKQLADNEEYKTLADEFEAKNLDLEAKYDEAIDRLSKNEEVLQAYADSQMEIVPEIFQDVVSRLPLLDRLQWFVDNSEKLQEKKSAAIPHTPQGHGTGKVSDEERRRRATRTF